MRGELADLRTRIGLKSAWISSRSNRSEPAHGRRRRRVARVAGDHDLGREQLAASLLHLDVNVRGGPAGIGDGLDRAEVVLAGRPGREPAEALEVPVLLIAALSRCRRCAGTPALASHCQISTVAFRTGLPGRVEDAAGQVRDLADGRGDVVVDDDQVVVGVRAAACRGRTALPSAAGVRSELLGEQARAW